MFVKSLELYPNALELHRNIMGLMVIIYIYFFIINYMERIQLDGTFQNELSEIVLVYLASIQE